LEVNADLFDEGNFAIALTHLIEPPTSMWNKRKKQLIANSADQKLTDAQFVASLFDYNNVYVWREGVRCRITGVGDYYVLLPVDDAGDLIADIDSYTRIDEYVPSVSINVESFIIGSKSAYNYESKKEQFYYKYCKTGDMTGFLTEYDSRFYFNLLDEIIIHNIVGGEKISKKTEILYSKIIEELDPFDIIIYLRDIKKYKNVSRLIRGGLPDLPPKTPMGYVKSKSIRIFDREDWIEITRGAMNRHAPSRENKHIIGFYDTSADGTTKFKLRPPVANAGASASTGANATATAGTVVDTRLIETGMVCDTKNKKDLMKIANSIGASNYDPQNVRIRDLCTIIQERLLDLEAKERQKGSSVKYIYLFNEVGTI
jgi:hypothetical protein